MNISATLNDDVLEMKNLRITSGHDDSIPFIAELYFNNKHIGSASNDGWGGDATLDICKLDKDTENAWNLFCKAVENITWAIITHDDKKTDMKYSIDFLMDCMAFQSICLKNNKFDWKQY